MRPETFRASAAKFGARYIFCYCYFTNFFSRLASTQASHSLAASGTMYGSTHIDSAAPTVIALPARTDTMTNHAVPKA